MKISEIRIGTRHRKDLGDIPGLAESINTIGLLQPIVVTPDGLLIAGERRLTAAKYIGWADISATIVDLGEIISGEYAENEIRKDFTTSERVEILAAIETFSHGGTRRGVQEQNFAVDKNEAAKRAGLGNRETARQAKSVVDNGAPELVEAMDNGTPISTAADIATLTKEEQAEIIRLGEKATLDAAKEIRKKRSEASSAARIDKIAEISAGNEELKTDKKYPVIYADPPWQYENPPMGGSNRSIENHYPTMTLKEICALPVKEIVTDDAMLYLWATAPKLEECMKVIKSWGFEYRTCFVWVKDKIGMGYHARNQHELLLVAKRGKIPAPPVEARVSSVIKGARTKHSAKPLEVYALIESMYPKLNRIELFSRTPQDGWDVWGNQSNEK